MPQFDPFWMKRLPPTAKDQVMGWLLAHGVDPSMCAGFDLLPQDQVEATLYVPGPDGNAQWDQSTNTPLVQKRIFTATWTPLGLFHTNT